MSLLIRTCPACGAQTENDHCPADGTRTLQMQALRPDATQLFAGELIADRYRVTEVLGRGGFGAVYRAVHTGTRQAVALKLLHVRDAADGGFDEIDARRFFREAEITASLRHPNTVRVFDLGQTERGALYLAMELLEGDTLEARLRKLALAGQWLPLDEVIRIASDVLGSLAEAHDRGLVHRDLKPANLMLTSVAGEAVTKVLDFGIARQQGSSLTSGNAAVGTPQYMAPEQCMGQSIDGRADLYALGIILFRCLAGVLPFDDGNPMTVMMKQVAEPAPDLVARASQRVPPAVGRVVGRVLSKDPADRYADARTMRSALLAALTEPSNEAIAMDTAKTPGPGPVTESLLLMPTPHTGATPLSLANAAVVAPAPAVAPVPAPQAATTLWPARWRPNGLVRALAALAVGAIAATASWLAQPAPPSPLQAVGLPPAAAATVAAATPVPSSAVAPAAAVPAPAAPLAVATTAAVVLEQQAAPPPAAELARKPPRSPSARVRAPETKHYVD